MTPGHVDEPGFPPWGLGSATQNDPPSFLNGLYMSRDFLSLPLGR